MSASDLTYEFTTIPEPLSPEGLLASIKAAPAEVLADLMEALYRGSEAELRRRLQLRAAYGAAAPTEDEPTMSPPRSSASSVSGSVASSAAKPKAKAARAVPVGASGCREPSKCFRDGQRLSHKVAGDIWEATYHAATDSFRGANGTFESLSKWVKAHQESQGKATSVNAWAVCKTLVDGEWISTMSLPFLDEVEAPKPSAGAATGGASASGGSGALPKPPKPPTPPKASKKGAVLACGHTEAQHAKALAVPAHLQGKADTSAPVGETLGTIVLHPEHGLLMLGKRGKAKVLASKLYVGRWIVPDGAPSEAYGHLDADVPEDASVYDGDSDEE